MSETLKEFLNGGLVTARHPALLAPGELQRADDCVYRERDPAIWRAPARTLYNSVALGAPSPIKGLANLTTDNQETAQLLSYIGTSLVTSDLTAITGTFTEVGGPGQVIRDTGTGTTFTTLTGFPFLASIVGASITGTGVPVGCTVLTVVGASQDGTTGHYGAITLSVAATTASITATFPFGIVRALENSGTETLETVQWQSNYYAWFGHGSPYALSWRPRPTTATGGSLANTLIARPMGLNAIVSPFTIATTAGTWSTTLGAGVYWFLITEIYAPGGDVTAAERDPALTNKIVESAYLAPDNTASDPSVTKGRPKAITITDAATQGVLITFPAITNKGRDGRISTNWGVYMYGPTPDTTTPPSLAQFRRVGTPQITETTFTLKNSSTPPQLLYPTLRASDDGQAEFGAGLGDGVQNDILGAPDLRPVFAKSGSSTDAPGVQNAVSKLHTFNFSVTGTYLGATITGIEVQVTGLADPSGNAGTKAGFYVHVDTTSKHTAAQFSEFGTPYGTKYIGGPMDTLGVTWALSDIDTAVGNISVTIGKTGTGSRQRLGIDAVGLKVYFNGSSITLTGPAYRVITYRDQVGTTVSDPANLPPPNCSTGDIWNGSLVLNDMAAEGAIRYSLPLAPESFPKPYILQPTTRTRSKVTFIRSLNQVLFVGFQNETKRINYLPRETDTDFQQGIAHEDLSTDHGIPGPLAGVKFDMPGQGSVIIYASTNGIYMTNGITTRPVNLDLDWANTVNINNLSTCIFHVYPKEKWLILYYNPFDATHTRNTKALVFSYAADKIKEGGMLPCTGPLTVSARAACEATINGVPYIFTGHETTGKIYVEDQGTTQPTGYQVHNSTDTLTDTFIQPLIRTRHMYLAGLERDGRETRIYLLYSSYGTTITASSNTTRDSAAVTSAAAFTSVLVGMRVIGTGIEPGTIVIAKTDSSNITISTAANAAGTAVTLSFDTGTIAISIRGSNMREATTLLGTSYDSTTNGDLLSVHLDHIRRGIELQIEKVVLPSALSVDLNTNMRIHQIVILGEDGGLDQSRSTG